MLGLTLVLFSAILLPLLYHTYVEPLAFATRFVAGLLIALIGSIALYFTYRASAQNQP
jgi:uncharacterized membrane protein YraQ (UPF0718 family)